MADTLYIWHWIKHAYTLSRLLTGKSRILIADAAKMALVRLGATGGTPGSPTPAGGASDSIRIVSMSGHWGILNMG